MSEADPSTVMFCADVVLGEMPSDNVAYPAVLQLPQLGTTWHKDKQATCVEVDIGDSAVHAQYAGGEVTYRFHGPDGRGSKVSPWPGQVTDRLIPWVTALATEVGRRMPDLDSYLESVMSTFAHGMTVHVDNDHDEGTVVQFVTFPVEHVVDFRPWPGTGMGEHHHVDGAEDRVELCWTGDGVTIPIAVALSDDSGVHAWVFEGIDWTAVGVSQEEALAWLVNDHVNCKALDVIRGQLRGAVLCRLAGISPELLSPFHS